MQLLNQDMVQGSLFQGVGNLEGPVLSVPLLLTRGHLSLCAQGQCVSCLNTNDNKMQFNFQITNLV